MKRPSAGSIAITALILGALCVALTHQAGADLLLGWCRLGRPGTIALIAATGILLIGGAAWLAHAATRGHRDSPARFIAEVTTMVAAVLSLTLVLAAAAVFIIPRCYA